jgi:hypothetical protein
LKKPASVFKGAMCLDAECRFLSAINDMASNQRVMPATLATYSDWIRGDVLKKGKQEHYLREIMGAVIKRLGRMDDS